MTVAASWLFYARVFGAVLVVFALLAAVIDLLILRFRR